MGLIGLMGPNPSYGSYSKPPFSEETYIKKLTLLTQTINHSKFSGALSKLRKNPTHELKRELRVKMNRLMKIDFAATEYTININEISKIISSTVDVFLQIGSKDEVPLLDRLRTWLYHNKNLYRGGIYITNSKPYRTYTRANEYEGIEINEYIDPTYTYLNDKIYEAALTLIEVGSRELPSIDELLQDQTRSLVAFKPRNSSNNFNNSNNFSYQNQNKIKT